MVHDSSDGTHHGRILVADDEPHIRRVLVTLLQNAEYEIDEATDGHKAKECLEAGNAYDFILLDLMMPGASGIEVLEYIRDNPIHADTPVILLTAKGQDADRDAAMSRGASDFMTKPFSPKKLLARIEEILAAD